MPIVPCKDCDEREVGCHSSCALYMAYREEVRKRNERAEKDRRAGDDYMMLIKRRKKKAGK